MQLGHQLNLIHKSIKTYSHSYNEITSEICCHNDTLRLRDTYRQMPEPLQLTSALCLFVCILVCAGGTVHVCVADQLKRNTSRSGQHLLWPYILLAQVRQQTALGHLNPALTPRNTHMSCLLKPQLCLSGDQGPTTAFSPKPGQPLHSLNSVHGDT